MRNRICVTIVMAIAVILLNSGCVKKNLSFSSLYDLKDHYTGIYKFDKPSTLILISTIARIRNGSAYYQREINGKESVVFRGMGLAPSRESDLVSSEIDLDKNGYITNKEMQIYYGSSSPDTKNDNAKGFSI